MKVDTLDWLVDTQPVYAATIELFNDAGMYPPPVKVFLRHKLKDEVQHLRDAAKHIEKRLKQWDEQMSNKRSSDPELLLEQMLSPKKNPSKRKKEKKPPPKRPG